MSESEQEPPLSDRELKWLRELLHAYRQDVEGKVESEIPDTQKRIRRRLRGDAAPDPDPLGPAR